MLSIAKISLKDADARLPLERIDHNILCLVCRWFEVVV